MRSIADHEIFKLAYLKDPRKIAQYLGTTPERVERGLRRGRRSGKSERAAERVNIRPSVHKGQRPDFDPDGLIEMHERVKAYVGRQG